MVLVEKLDDVGKAGWIVATIAGFWLFWPIGLAILMFLCWSGRMRAWRYERRGQWYNAPPGAAPGAGPGRGPRGFGGPGFFGGPGWGGPGWGGCGWRSRGGYAPPSGNQAFDEYRAETLRRLEEEQREFVEYLERLRQAKDKAEFDQFMAERRRPTPPDIQEQA